MLSKSFNITIDSGVSAQGHGKEVVHGLNATEKWFIFHSMATVKLPSSQSFDAQMEMHTYTHKYDVSLAK